MRLSRGKKRNNPFNVFLSMSTDVDDRLEVNGRLTSWGFVALDINVTEVVTSLLEKSWQR